MYTEPTAAGSSRQEKWICYMVNIYLISGVLKEPKISSFSPGKFFQKMKMDKNKCPKTDLPKYFPQNTCFVTINYFYGLVTEKIIFNL